MTSKKKENREVRFVEEYLIDLNATAACRRAGYTGTRAVLATKGYELLRKDDVAAAVRAGMAKRSARVEVHQDEVLQVLLDILRTDLGEFFDEVGKPLPLEQVPDHVRRAIQSIEVEELFEGYGEDRIQKGLTHKVKLWSKDKALELALRHLGLLNDKLKHEGGLTLEQLLTEATKPTKPGGT